MMDEVAVTHATLINESFFTHQPEQLINKLTKRTSSTATKGMIRDRVAVRLNLF